MSATLLGASGGARWDRFFWIVVVFAAVLVIRTVLVRLLGHRDDASTAVHDDDVTETDE
jgi:hypothetical protein